MKKHIRFWIYSVFAIGAFLIFTNSCKKDDENNNADSIGTVTDIDGNVYNTVTIGTQVWMAQNLGSTKYRNGDNISNNSWNYNNDATTGNKFGKLYDGYAVSDKRNIAPIGWHVATEADWETLKNFVSANLSNSGSVAKALASKTEWNYSTNLGAIGNDLTKNNSSGFNALPAGYRSGSGEFKGIGKYATWWSSTSSGSSSYLLLQWDIAYDDSGIGSESGGSVYGFSIRCVKD